MCCVKFSLASSRLNPLKHKNDSFSKKTIKSLADPGGCQGSAPPWGPNYFIFMQFLAKKLQNKPNLGIGAPPRENPGSATVDDTSEYLSANLPHIDLFLNSYSITC